MTLAVLRRLFVGSVLAIVLFAARHAAAAEIELPLGRTTYFAGELVPVAWPKTPDVRLQAVQGGDVVELYRGASQHVLIDTNRLAPGDYRLRLAGSESEAPIRIVSTLRRSAGSLQDEWQLPQPRYPEQKQLTPEERQQFDDEHWKKLAETLDETRLTAFVPMAQADLGQLPWLDAAARNGALAMPNPDTRPTSFFPVGNHPGELESMSQRLILGAQANGKYPNFGGYLLGWDTTGHGIGNRRGLLTYWGWGDKTEALRTYLARIDQHTQDEFQRRTGLAPVTEAEYIAYLLSIKRPEFATLIDLPTRHWLAEIAEHTQPMEEQERADFERRLDAWSAYLMGLYHESYSSLGKNLRELDPSLKATASVQVDHAPVRFGQYFPMAYEPLDFQYQSTWNDQVGGPDYAYQWLFTAGLLDMHRNGKPTWLSNAFGTVHDRSKSPGKFVRVAAHGLPWGVSGIGFALEGFSNVTGGMNQHANWPEIEGKSGGADVVAGREFLDRFACLAVEGRGDHGVAILFSKSQYARQHVAMGFGTTPYQAFVSLTRLGYTPRFVTEEELVEQGGKIAEPSLLIAGQTFPFPDGVAKAIESFAAAGGHVVVDDGSTVEVSGAQKLGYAFSFTRLGKPHNWGAPNMPRGDNDALMAARWHQEIGPHLLAAFGSRGRGVLTTEAGAESNVSLLQIDGGPDAKYVIAVNDSHVQTQADWHQVREKLTPSEQAEGYVFDCTEERALGQLAPIDCDLTATTARVFAVLTREPKSIDLRAAQKQTAGDELPIAVRFLDASDTPISAVIPFHLQVLRPDGSSHVELYRSTDRNGSFGMPLQLAANAPGGQWKVVVRSQLNGDVATLPVAIVAASEDAKFVVETTSDAIVVRQKQAAEHALKSGASFVLPIFDSPEADKLIPAAEKVREVLAKRGVTVEIVRNPALSTYWLAYDPTPEQQAENARADGGEAFGKLKRETVNDNDWFSGASGWRFGKPLILLDVASIEGDNPLAESLGAAGMLWPQVTANYPGEGRAVVEATSWAFAPRVTTITIRAHEAAGLLAGAKALADLPEDRFTPHIESVKAELWRQFHVGGKPARAEVDGLTSEQLRMSQAPRPFAISFPSDRPVTAEQVVRAPRPEPPTVAVPGVVSPQQFVIFIQDGEAYTESATAEMLLPDLRFNDAIQVTIEASETAKYRLTATGVFRYSDRKPCWQAQWEDVIELREKLVPKVRQPMEFEVRLDDQPVGSLQPSKTEEREVALELASPSAALKPRTAVEEVVTELSGEFELPAGRHRLLFIHRNTVDGKLDTINIQR